MMPPVKVEEDGIGPIQFLKQLNQEQKTTEKWSQEERQGLYKLYQNCGPQWQYFSKFIGKTSKQIKNKFYTTLRKLVNRLQYIGNKKTQKRKKISYESLIRPLKVANIENDSYEKYADQINYIRKKIIQLCKSDLSDITLEVGEDLIDRIHQFNWKTKSNDLIAKKMKKTGKQQKKPSLKIQVKTQHIDS